MTRRVWCMVCGADVGAGHPACGCRPPLPFATLHPASRTEVRARRFVALLSAGVPEHVAQRLSEPDAVPS